MKGNKEKQILWNSIRCSKKQKKKKKKKKDDKALEKELREAEAVQNKEEKKRLVFYLSVY